MPIGLKNVHAKVPSGYAFEACRPISSSRNEPAHAMMPSTVDTMNTSTRFQSCGCRLATTLSRAIVSTHASLSSVMSTMAITGRYRWSSALPPSVLSVKYLFGCTKMARKKKQMSWIVPAMRKMQ